MSDKKKTDCEHPKYVHDIKIHEVDLKQVGGRRLVLKLKLTCNTCGRPFIFEGDAGFSTTGPTVSPDMTELRAPIYWPLRDEDEKKETTLQ